MGTLRNVIDLEPDLGLGIDWLGAETCDCTKVKRLWLYDQLVTHPCVVCRDCGTCWELFKWSFRARTATS